MTSLIVCFVNVFNISIMFEYINKPIDVMYNKTTHMHYEGIDSIENYVDFWNEKGQRVTLFPECKRVE